MNKGKHDERRYRTHEFERHSDTSVIGLNGVGKIALYTRVEIDDSDEYRHPREEFPIRGPDGPSGARVVKARKEIRSSLRGFVYDVRSSLDPLNLHRNDSQRPRATFMPNG